MKKEVPLKNSSPSFRQRQHHNVNNSRKSVFMNLQHQKVKIDDIKKGLFRNLRGNVPKIDGIALEKMPFWHTVFCKGICF